MGKRGAASAGAAERAARKPRSNEGAAEAKAAAVMTLEQWKALQVGMDEKWPAPAYMSDDVPRKSHTSYRDETYEFVTRWTADTKISYRPHAKSPGSKSHIRYESYSAATSVGEALQLGSFPVDWCWDYERGFLRVDGPVRDEPIDITQCTDMDALTEVDRVIYRWYNKELAKKLGVDYNDLFGTADPSLLRAHRLVAEREARARLEAADREGRRISDEDVTAALKAWAFVKNAARGNVIPEGQKWVWSDTLGLIRDRLGSIHATPGTRLYPAVVRLLVRYLQDRLPPEVAGFKFTSINLNCNYAARLHRDGNNFGPSFIKAFGDYTGGELRYWPEDDKSCELDALPKDAHVALSIGAGPDGGLALFNGNSAHSVADFKGNRFSVVYFALGVYDRAPDEEKDFLRSLGFAVPAPDEDRYALLRAPRGYKTPGAAQPLVADTTPRKDEPAAVRFWSNAALASQSWAGPQELPAGAWALATPPKVPRGPAGLRKRPAASAVASDSGKQPPDELAGEQP